MMTKRQQKEYYDALLKKDPGYEGIFYVGVKTTGGFCRPTCSARKPKFENNANDEFGSYGGGMAGDYIESYKYNLFCLITKEPLQH